MVREDSMAQALSMRCRRSSKSTLQKACSTSQRDKMHVEVIATLLLEPRVPFQYSLFKESINAGNSCAFHRQHLGMPYGYLALACVYSWPQYTFVSGGTVEILESDAHICWGVPSNNRPQPIANIVSPGRAAQTALSDTALLLQTHSGAHNT